MKKMMTAKQPIGNFPSLFVFATLSWIVLVSSANADGGPQNVLVVVNAAEPTSLAVANHFVYLRKVPANNVVYLDRVPEGRTCTFDVFRTRIGDLVLHELEERKIADHIDYIVFSTDFPTAVNCGRHLEILKQKTTVANEKIYNPLVATNSLMAFYLYAMNDDPSFMLLDSNWYFAAEQSDVLLRPFLGEEQQRYERGIADLAGDDHAAAINVFSELSTRHPKQVAAHYQLARALALSGRTREAIVALKRSIETGWQYKDFTAADEQLISLRDDSDFQKLLDTLADVPFGQIPSRGFTSQLVWGPNGWPNSLPDQGKRIWLSTMLGVAGGTRGCTRQQIIEQLQRSVSADWSMPNGTFYFSNTQNVRTRTRQPQFAAAILELQSIGFKAVEINTKTPNKRDDILGATIGMANVDWQATNSQFLPGAICDNLTSHGGGMADRSSQTPLTDFLKAGAAGASGTVVEPFAIAQKFPHARIYAHYARGCNLAESFYQSVPGPFQLLIVGDPLCQPWARAPVFEVGGLADGEPVGESIQLSLKPAADGPGISRYELYLDGRRGGIVSGSQKSVTLPTDDLTDGFHQLGIVAVDDTLIGCRASKQFGIVCNRSGKQVVLTVDGNGTYQVARSVLLNVSSNFGTKIEIRQHSRVVAVVDGPNGEARIDCYELGVGPSQLTAVVADENGSVSSSPVAIEIVP